jgi:polysaccharide chain length determinant protein (PEP-CTERM system associated)
MSQQDRDPARHEEEDDGGISWTQVRHFLHAPARRPLLVLLPWAGVLLLAVLAIFTLPKRYRSSALILVESERVPDSFVARVATEDTSRRIENIRPEILSRTRLERVVAETNPYPELGSLTRAVEALRGETSVNPSGTDGFTIEFVHRDPRKAQEVAERLATLFISESVRARGEQVEGAVDFLVAQVNEARQQLEAKDEALRRYKEARMGKLPEQLQTNLATLEMLQREMQAVEESLFLAREKQDALARAIERPQPRSAEPSPGSETLEELQQELAALRTRYTDQHPDVESLRARIRRVEARLSQQTPYDAAGASAVTREQLARAGEEVETLTERRSELASRIEGIRTRVEQTPRTEQELANLTRDYNKLSDNYTALLSKQLEAQMAGRLEQRWKGEGFRILDPANLPEKPDSPRRLRILMIGAMLGLLVGLGAALAAEALDRTVKDAEQLQSLLPYPILARIPHLPSLDRPGVR